MFKIDARNLFFLAGAVFFMAATALMIVMIASMVSGGPFLD